ncbi:hypothetical protein [Aquibacillus rhizosphaerae]|uniref:Uncharacterized protein n=1 Tax=Aquibacillus rhizosphaerae TaxID=3051431 RepID=A0ABT7LBE8_9BACI|nr:hypothetical protein [Aquibacillus sp. LR5S19]MDL4843189.1 hypothetical protein [Aquibacillus sp. LR5S19]
MKPYQIKNMIIDDGFYNAETVTADFTSEGKNFSVTFDKSDLGIVNAWAFENHTSVPIDLPEDLIESIKQDVKKKI